MKTPDRKPPSMGLRWLLGLLGLGLLGLLAVTLWACIDILPPRLYPPLTSQDLAGLTPAERAERIEGRSKLENDARTTLLQALAALLVLGGAGLGAWATFRQVGISRKGLEDARDRAQVDANQAHEQLEVARQQLQTERFTRAVDQLDTNRALAVRLGGLYALERIARDSPHDRATVAEVLCAYVRTMPRREPPAVAKGSAIDASASSIKEVEAIKPVSRTVRAPDVQAAVAILGRWERRLGERPADLDLHGGACQPR